MDKYIFDEINGLWYELQEDYYIPCLINTAYRLMGATPQAVPKRA